MPGPGVELVGLDEFRRELRRVDPRLGRQLQVANKEISQHVASRGQSRVAALGGPRYGKAAAGIRPRAKQREATIALLPSNRLVRAAVLGARIHWVFGRPVPAHTMVRPVWGPWVGRNWTPEEGLYGLSPAIKEAIPMILDTYGDRVLDALGAAFPD